MKNIIIIHGEKLDRDGSMKFEFIQRLNISVGLIKQHFIDYIIITGGETRKNFPTEAETGFNYLFHKISVPIVLENKARTTVDNILFTKKIIENEEINSVYVVSSKKRMIRIKLLYRILWPEILPKCSFVSAPDRYSMFFYVTEIIYLLLGIFDPYEKTFAFISKRLFRNAFKGYSHLLNQNP